MKSTRKYVSNAAGCTIPSSTQLLTQVLSGESNAVVAQTGSTGESSPDSRLGRPKRSSIAVLSAQLPIALILHRILWLIFSRFYLSTYFRKTLYTPFIIYLLSKYLFTAISRCPWRLLTLNCAFKGFRYPRNI